MIDLRLCVSIVQIVDHRIVGEKKLYSFVFLNVTNKIMFEIKTICVIIIKNSLYLD